MPRAAKMPRENRKTIRFAICDTDTTIAAGRVAAVT